MHMFGWAGSDVFCVYIDLHGIQMMQRCSPSCLFWSVKVALGWTPSAFRFSFWACLLLLSCGLLLLQLRSWWDWFKYSRWLYSVPVFSVQNDKAQSCFLFEDESIPLHQFTIFFSMVWPWMATTHWGFLKEIIPSLTNTWQVFKPKA